MSAPGDSSTGLPVEREETYLWLTSGRKSSKAALLATRALVDKAIPADENALRSLEGLLSAGTRSELNAYFASLGQHRQHQGRRRFRRHEPAGRAPGVRQHRRC